MNIVALIPARAGSQRVPGKNIKPLAGKPLIHWTIEAAAESGVFSDIVVSTEDPAIMEIAAQTNLITPHARLPEHATVDAPDIWWVEDFFAYAPHQGRTNSFAAKAEAFAILRPTSPFRTAATIRRALDHFSRGHWSSMRAVEPVKQHPGKMWQVHPYGETMKPFVDGAWPAQVEGWDCLRPDWQAPWHSKPTQFLPKVYIQNSSLEMAWTWCVNVFHTISGPKVKPFLTEGMEGFSIDYPDDWDRAEAYAQTLLARVP